MNPRAKKVKNLEKYKIEVEFTNGEIKQFDVGSLMKFPVYQSLKDEIVFQKVFVRQGIVQWPNEVDISPDLLYIESQ